MANKIKNEYINIIFSIQSDAKKCKIKLGENT